MLLMLLLVCVCVYMSYCDRVVLISIIVYCVDTSNDDNIDSKNKKEGEEEEKKMGRSRTS